MSEPNDPNRPDPQPSDHDGPAQSEPQPTTPPAQQMPDYGQPAGGGYSPPPAYGAPNQPGGYGTPPQGAPGGYGSPQYGSPQYGSPQYGAPGQYAQPDQYGPGQYGPGQYGAGQYGAGQYGAQQFGPGQYGAGQYGPPQQETPYGPGPYGAEQPGAAPQPGFYGAPPANQYPTTAEQPTPSGGGQFDGGQFGGGDQFSAMATPRGKSGRRTFLLIGGGVVLLVAAILLFTAFVIPGWAPKTISQDAVQDGVRTVLTEEYAASDVTAVSCPSGQRVREGSSFECTVTIGGQEQTVTITFVDDDGTYEVSRPTN
ncbi:MAG: DUF4333 domain-containing protein [Actinomycetota bacterium]|nr:DUF4333 domain-containing protein [Actinomycetota bacterium]